MSAAVIPVVFLALLCVVIGIGYLGHLQAKRRREGLALAASERGWRYVERDDAWTTRFDGHPFGQGHARQARNVLEGSHDGRPFTAFDYHYETTETSTDAEGRTSTRTVDHDFSIVALALGAAFPRLTVTPEGFFTRAVGRLLNKDIELESEEFNRAFTVTCPDRRFASDVLHPQMMEYLLTYRDLGWSFQSGWALVARPGRHAVAQVEAELATLDGLADRIPEFVWAEFRGPAAPTA